MPGGYINFPGISYPRSAVVTRTLGARPNTALIWSLPVGDVPDTSGSATFTFGYDTTFCTWTNCLCDRTTMEVTQGGQHQVYVIKDKRWRWSRTAVTMAFNVRQADGSIDSATSYSLANMALYILSAMGESSVDVSLVTSTEQPELILDYDNGADALEELLHTRGYVISLQADDSVKIWPRGVGWSIPNDSDVTTLSITVNPPEFPKYLKAVGDKTLVQSMLKCQAVGLDTDGSIKAVNDLSYIPSGGWTGKDLVNFDYIPTVTAKECAKLSVGKWYQVNTQADGTHNLNIDGFNYLPGEVVVTSGSQYLPIHRDQVNSKSDVFGKMQFAPAYVSATYYSAETNPAGNTSTITRLEKKEWNLNREKGIVMFKESIYKNDGSTRTFADVYLTCTYCVHDSTTNVKDRYVRSLDMGGIGVDVRKLEHYQRQIIASYSTGTSIASISHNTAILDAEADQYLNQAQYSYTTQVANLVQYRGIRSFSTDGVNLQIRWNLAVNDKTPFSTTVSQYAEGLPLLPSLKERELMRRATQDERHSNRRVRRYHQDKRRVR